jgi:CheY-like chemotaxis protein
MGGQIGAASQAGQGSCFWFELPAAKVSLGEAGTDSQAAVVIPEGCRVLVVDDRAVNRDLVCAVLRVFGAEMTEAADGEAAVGLASAEPFDVILMDLRMPGIGGVEATRQIREVALNGNVPIIAFSADVGGALPEGVFDGMIAKPLDARALITEINRALFHEGESEDVA